MKIKIGIPNNPAYNSLFSKVDIVKNQFDCEVFTLPEKQIAELFNKNRLDLAVLTPIGYSFGVKNSDYRILPEKVFGAKGFTGLISYFFRKGLGNVKTCSIPSEDEYLSQISKIIIHERYGLFPNFIPNPETNVDKLLEDYHSALVIKSLKNSYHGLDITEDWLDMFSYPLPILFWVAKNEEVPNNSSEIINAFFDDEKFNETDIYARHPKEDEDFRIGNYIYNWTDDFDDALHFTLELLYMHKLIDVIPAIKVHGRD